MTEDERKNLIEAVVKQLEENPPDPNFSPPANRLSQTSTASGTPAPKPILAPHSWILPVVLVAVAAGLSAVAAAVTGPVQIALGVAATVVSAVLGALGYASNGIKK